MVIEVQEVITHHYSYYAFQCTLLKNTSITQIYFNHHGNSTYMSDKGQETVGCLYREICNL